MSLFSTLMGKIFSHPAASASASAPSQPAGGSPGIGATADGGASAPLGAPTADPASAPAAAPAPGTAAPAPAPAQSVDVAAVMKDLSSKSSEKLDWQKSIVDLMNLVGMDSSLSARKTLATELGYSGDENDSATMNVWLHKAVMQKLAENGGKVPAELMS